MDFYTSITSNYIPKARVLAHSVKRAAPGSRFHLLLSDVPPAGFDVADEPFDTMIPFEELPVPNPRQWLFGHSIVELCTAVKGVGAQEIVRRHQPRKLCYFDPDIVVFGGLDALSERLDRHSVLLTPHVTSPEATRRAVIDNEISALKHGIYNLGFIGFSCEGEGMRCLDWWAQRLLEFCHDDIPAGLFTDQRWADLMPAMFERVGILRDPEYNVATWNLTHRSATGSAPDHVLVNGRPLAFYHFSGFDSGAQEVMLKVYGGHSPVLFKLRDWYIAQCRLYGQDTLGRTPWAFGRFSNGEPISRDHRLLYRTRVDLQRAFPDPFDADSATLSYYQWFRDNVQGDESTLLASEAILRDRLVTAETELRLIKGSRSWRLARSIARLANAVR